jgi:hypothetical protein
VRCVVDDPYWKWANKPNADLASSMPRRCATLSLLPLGAAAAGGASLFAQGTDLSSQKVSECLAALILFTLGFEVVMERIEARFEHQPRAQNVMRKLLTELTVLGFISFFVFLLINSGALQHSSYFFAFEFAHIMLFFVALLLIAQAVITFRVWNHVNELWMRTSLVTPAELRGQWKAATLPRSKSARAAKKDNGGGGGGGGGGGDSEGAAAAARSTLFAALQLGAGSSRAGFAEQLVHRVNHTVQHHALRPLGFGHAKLQRGVEFHLLKNLFLGRCNLPINFNFATYLGQTLAENIGESVEVEPQSWAAILAFLGFNVLRTRLWGETADATAMIHAFGALGVAILLCYVALIEQVLTSDVSVFCLLTTHSATPLLVPAPASLLHAGECLHAAAHQPGGGDAARVGAQGAARRLRLQRGAAAHGDHGGGVS